VSVVNAATNTVTATIPISSFAGLLANVAVTPDGSKAYVAGGPVAGTVSVIDAATNTVNATIAVVGSEPFGVAITPAAALSPSEVATTASGLAYSRVSRTFNGTVTITNISSNTINGPFQIVLKGLTAGVTLANATGVFAGSPYLTAPGVTGLASGQSATVAVRFDDPSFATINFTPAIYAGSF
jgi:YVTN family beta-propeller protein